jgi:hypothetical protein
MQIISMQKQNSVGKPSQFPATCFAVLLCLGLLLAGSGCGTTGGTSSGSFAAVTIQNHTVEEIAAATVQEFGADGYQGGGTAANQMVFEKVASRGTSLAREGILPGASGAQTINRVRVEIVPLAGGQYRLACKAFMVTGGSDPFFQNEVALANVRSGPYQSLLNKVQKNLK